MAATTANTPETMIPEGGVANFAVLEFAIFFLMKGCWWAGVLGWMERRSGRALLARCKPVHVSVAPRRAAGVCFWSAPLKFCECLNTF